MELFLFSVPLALCTVIGCLSGMVHIPIFFTVCLLIKHWVAPESRRVVFTVVLLPTCTGMVKVILFLVVLYMLATIATHETASLRPIKNPPPLLLPQSLLRVPLLVGSLVLLGSSAS